MIKREYVPEFVEILDRIENILKSNAKEYAETFENSDPNIEEKIYNGSVVTFIGMVVDRFMDSHKGK